MRSKDEVQWAHDLLTGLILELKIDGPESDSEKALVAAADVLCWVLEHEHNKTFSGNLEKVRAFALSLGMEFPDCPTINH